MPIPGSHTQAFVTGEWTVEPSRNLLVRGADEIRLEPRVIDVLVFLARRRGDVVSKEELVAAVWEGRHVSDDVLTVTIYTLRKALGDEARQPRYIETVPRRGYRWLADVLPPAPAERLAAPGKGGRIVWSASAAALVLATLAAVLGLTWKGRPTARVAASVSSPEAREAYVKGRYYLDQRTLAGLELARDQFERAIALAPKDPAAHAGLADTYSSMADFGVGSSAELRPRAMASAGRALGLNHDSAEGHEALGRARFLFDWNFAGAARSLKRAAELNPDYMPTYQATAWLRSARGEYAEAVAAARRALQLDPVNTARYCELAWVLGLGGRHEEAIRELERALLLNPRSFQAFFMKAWAIELAGRPDAAFAAYREALRVSGAPDVTLQKMEALYRSQGLRGCYRAWLDRERNGMPLTNTVRAQLFVRLGELDRAIESVEAAYDKRESALAWINVEPSFDAIRSDARFQRVAGRVGTPN